MYRKDVLGRASYMFKQEESEDRPNFAALGRESGCDYLTAKPAWEKARNAFLVAKDFLFLMKSASLGPKPLIQIYGTAFAHMKTM